MSVTIKVEREFRPYTVQTSKATLEAHHNAIFDRKLKPLCTQIRNTHGYEIDGCEDSAAFTSWSIDLGEQTFYAADGRKQPVTLRCIILTVLPQWSSIEKTSKAERAEVRRFELRTAYHERGHGLACEHTAKAIKRFLEELPSEVPVSSVPQMNEAVKTAIHRFYIPMAKESDRAYDEVTGHGLTQGAEAQNKIDD